MTDEQLIELVKRYPVLYDMSLGIYRDHSVRNNAWEEIAEQMNTSSKFHYKYLFITKQIDTKYTYRYKSDIPSDFWESGRFLILSTSPHNFKLPRNGAFTTKIFLEFVSH